MSKYFIYINKLKEGPYALEELLTKPLTPDTLVWSEGFADWKLAKNVPELSDVLSKIPPEPNCAAFLPMPKTWFVESILVTIFCCLPFGILGIIEASNVKAMYRAGNYEQAIHHSKWAQIWIAWGFFSMLAFIALYILSICIVAMYTVILPNSNY